MAEYIERAAAINRLQEISNDYEDAKDMDAYYVADYCLHHVMELKPAADVRPVVTCERCVYHVDLGYHYCNKWCVNCPDDADFFCAYGEGEES